MTFSLVARDPNTGAFGMVISSSSPAVAARCTNLRAGVGAASSQNVTNPALGARVLDLLAAGADAETAVQQAAAEDAYPQFRQLTAVDVAGRAAVFSGEQSLGVHTARIGDGAVAAGNLLASERTIEELLAGFARSQATSFEERLLAGLQAALAAGGEAGPVRSCGLAVVEAEPFRVTDLRVDDRDQPISELARLLEHWLPQKEAYRVRAANPTQAPSYGVPGDE